MIFQGDQLFIIKFFQLFTVHVNGGQFETGLPGNSLIFNSLTFFWNVKETYRVVMIFQGDKFFNI